MASAAYLLGDDGKPGSGLRSALVWLALWGWSFHPVVLRGQEPPSPGPGDSVAAPPAAATGPVSPAGASSESLDKASAGPLIEFNEQEGLRTPSDEPRSAGTATAPAIVDYLIVPRIGIYGRRPVHVDPVASAIARGTWSFPAAADEIRGADGRLRTWRAAQVGADGWLRHEDLRGGYAAARFAAHTDGIFLLEASGHVVVYVNGEPRAGDPYQTGKTVTPVRLRQGDNQLVFHVAGGELQARLIAPKRKIGFDMRDATLPDLIVSESQPIYGAALLVNATAQPLLGAELTTVRPGGRKITSAAPAIPPLSVRRVVIPIDGALTEDEAEANAVRVQMDLTMPGDESNSSREVVDTQAFDLTVAERDQLQTRTFLSKIDGGVQSYAFVPAATPAPSPINAAAAPGLLIALHRTGASAVEPLRNVHPIPWAHIVAPTGRRPVGFDWEDWSRIDVFEAVNDVRRRNEFDEQRVSLAGSGAGGHGALRIAALTPDRFAALSAVGGWLSYHTYGQSVATWARPNRVQSLLNRCAEASRTLPLLKNLATVGVSIEHDVGDPEAPLAEARTIRRRLAEFHGDFAYRERMTGDDAPHVLAISHGQAPAEFLFSRSTPRREQVDQVDFTTFNLAESSSNQWLEIFQQLRQFDRTTASVACNAAERRFVGVTRNVAALAFDVSHLSPGEDVQVQLDGQLLSSVPWPEQPPLRVAFTLRDGRWQLQQRLDRQQKFPQRQGGFRSAWDNRVVLVYGTSGNAEENAWSLAKARFDAESFLVRGAGSVEVVADAEFSLKQYADRNVVLYGNVDTNAAWGPLLSTSPVQVRTGRINVGLRPEWGDDLAVLLIRPRRDSDAAIVAAVSGTSIVGMRATDRVPYFVSGLALPDLLIFGAEALERGSDAFRAAGFFGLDWSVENGEIAWRDAAL